MGACFALIQKMGGRGHLLGAGNFWCVAIAHMAMGKCSHCPYRAPGLCMSHFCHGLGHKRLRGRLLHTTMNLCRTLDQNLGWVGGGYAVGVHSAFYGTK